MPVTAFTVTFPVKFGVGRGGLAWTLAQNYVRSEEPLGMLRYIVHTQTPYVESYSRDTCLSSPKISSRSLKSELSSFYHGRQDSEVEPIPKPEQGSVPQGDKIDEEQLISQTKGESSGQSASSNLPP